MQTVSSWSWLPCWKLSAALMCDGMPGVCRSVSVIRRRCVNVWEQSSSRLFRRADGWLKLFCSETGEMQIKGSHSNRKVAERQTQTDTGCGRQTCSQVNIYSFILLMLIMFILALLFVFFSTSPFWQICVTKMSTRGCQGTDSVIKPLDTIPEDKKVRVQRTQSGFDPFEKPASQVKRVHSENNACITAKSSSTGKESPKLRRHSSPSSVSVLLLYYDSCVYEKLVLLMTSYCYGLFVVRNAILPLIEWP